NLTSTDASLSALTGNNVGFSLSAIPNYLIITPTECFNAVTLSIGSGGLLNLLSVGSLKVYHAYYECPEIAVSDPDEICEGESTALVLTDPASCGSYTWYDSEIDGNQIGTGTVYNTGPLTETTTFYIEYSGIDNSVCGRTPVE